MGIIEHTIDVFEKRVSELDKIRYLPELPQWTDADVIAASCLITEYRNLTSQCSGRDGTCHCAGKPLVVNGRCHGCGKPRR